MLTSIIRAKLEKSYILLQKIQLFGGIFEKFVHHNDGLARFSWDHAASTLPGAGQHPRNRDGPGGSLRRELALLVVVAPRVAKTRQPAASENYAIICSLTSTWWRLAHVRRTNSGSGPRRPRREAQCAVRLAHSPAQRPGAPRPTLMIAGSAPRLGARAPGCCATRGSCRALPIER